ncbi:MAG TPA: HD domain-containing phosphohydrolase, partial [Anaerolineales bacterium]|nr:HD domain-containing phosphohydrolase [Anaerolineales bacterium]
GLRALELLQEKGYDLPFIIVSGTIGEDEAVACVRRGAADYLLKDRMARLGGSVAQAIEAKRLRDEQRLAQEALRRSEARWRTYIQGAKDLIFALDDSGCFTLVNRAVCDALGRSENELLGQSALQFIVPETRGPLATQIERVKAGEAFKQVEVEALSKDGRHISLEVRGFINRQDGRAVESFLIARDISQRKRRESEREAIIMVATALRTASRRDEMLPVILEQAMDLLHAGGAAMAMIDPLSGETVVELGVGVWASITGMRLPANDGLSGRVMATREPFCCADVRNEAGISRRAIVRGMYAVAAVPLIARERTIGVLWIVRSNEISPDEIRIMAAIADISANGIHRATLYEQTEGRMQRLDALRSIDLAISSSLDLRVTLNVLLEQVLSLLNVHAADVLLLNPQTQVLTYRAGCGFRTGVMSRAQMRLGDGHAGQAALERQIVRSNLTNDSGSMARAQFLAGEGFVSYCGVPLLAKGQVKGVLEVFHRSELSYSPEWLEFLETLAGQAAIAIDSAELFEAQDRTHHELVIAYDATIEGWARALEMRDVETEGHSRRVTEMSLRLASAMGLGEAELVHVQRGALLHDIGKMGIPDEILRKQGPLTEEEWEIMHQHPVHAYNLLAPITFLRPALEIPYCHHERWDGSGYPRGLKGEQIPLPARIFAIVDVWDALLSERPYRPAWPESKALAHIKEQAGAHFDPRVVDAFLKLLAQI